MRTVFIIITFTVSIVTITTNGMAFGVGVYGNYSGGKSEYNYLNVDEMSVPLSSNYGACYINSGGGGIMFEIADIKGKPVELYYRFKVGSEAVFTTKDISKVVGRYDFINLFYFKIFQHNYFSILLGPQIGTNYHQVTKTMQYLDFFLVSFNYYSYARPTFNKSNILIKSGGINLGLSLNFDFTISDKFVFFIQLSGEENIYFSKYKITNILMRLDFSLFGGLYRGHNNIKKLQTNYSTEGSIGIGFMYRV